MRARKAPGNARHEIFVISAHMEWRYDKNDKPARNVFELGLKKHILVPEYVKLYAEFLVGINDVANARVLFERAVAVAADAASGKIDSDSKNIIPGTNRTTGVLSMGPQERERRTNVLRDVFDLFVSFEHHHGSSGTMSSVEQRRHVALGGPGGGAIDAAPAILTALIARHSFLDLAPCTFEQQAHYVKLGATMPRRNTSVDTKNTNVPPAETAAATERRSASRRGVRGGGCGGSSCGSGSAPKGTKGWWKHSQNHASAAGARLRGGDRGDCGVFPPRRARCLLPFAPRLEFLRLRSTSARRRRSDGNFADTRLVP